LGGSLLLGKTSLGNIARPSQKQNKNTPNTWAGGVVQVVECLLSKHKTLSLKKKTTQSKDQKWPGSQLRW
jgi:hypothetical protein